MTNKIIRHIVIAVRDDDHVAMTEITSNFVAVRSTLLLLLLLLLLLATAAARHPVGTTPGVDGDSDVVDDDSNESYARDSVDDNFGNKVNDYGKSNDYYGKGNDTYHEANYMSFSGSSLYFKNISEIQPSPREFLADVFHQRKLYKSMTNYDFNDNRTRILSSVKEVPEWTQGVVYWMYREHRVQDNWAMIKAQQLALEKKVPLYVVYCRSLQITNNTIRQYRIIIEGLKTVQAECKKLDIGFHYASGYAVDIIPEFVDKHNVGAIVVDFMPLRDHTHWIRQLVNCTGSRVPIIQVDAHNVVPCWLAALKRVINARIMRYILDKQNSTYLTEFPTVFRHPYSGNLKARPINWVEPDTKLTINTCTLPVPSIKAGYMAGMHTLHYFIKNKLQTYHVKRQNPLKNGLSNLSPWLHFGHISAQRVILEVYKFAKSSPRNVKEFMKEIFIRRELSDNYCFYTPKYDRFEGAPIWSKNSINKHRNDYRKYVYSRYRLERALTHNDLFNSAQLQLVREGKMHRFLRMYWAKKIMEWSKTPEAAITNANHINNKYSIDGRDPNGYVGVLWAIAGLHDRPWKDRPVVGAIRFLSYQRCNIKFDTQLFVHQYGGKVYPYRFQKFEKQMSLLQDTQNHTQNHMQNYTKLK